MGFCKHKSGVLAVHMGKGDIGISPFAVEGKPVNALGFYPKLKSGAADGKTPEELGVALMVRFADRATVERFIAVLQDLADKMPESPQPAA